MGTAGSRVCEGPKGLAASARSPCNPGGLRKTVGLFRNLDPYLYLRQENRPSELFCPNAPVGFSTLPLRLFGYLSMVLIKPVAVSTISRFKFEVCWGLTKVLWGHSLDMDKPLPPDAALELERKNWAAEVCWLCAHEDWELHTDGPRLGCSGREEGKHRAMLSSPSQNNCSREAAVL